MIDAAEFVVRARTWEGVPFHHQGRSRDGVDCVGLPIAVLAEAGALPAGFDPPTNYGRIASGELEEQLARWCTPADVPRLGTLVAIVWPRAERPSHVAICAGAELIHAYRAAGRVVIHGYRGPWVRRTAGAWLLPGVRYE